LMHLGNKLLFLAILAVILAAHACSPQSTPTPPDAGPASSATPTPSPTPVNPQALLEMSGEAMAELESFHFELAHTSGSTPLAQSLMLEEAKGDVARPDRLSLSFSGMAGNFAVRGSLITTGDTSYMTNPLNGRWEQVPAGVSPLSFFNPTQGITEMMSQVEQPTLLSDNGSTYRVGGVIAADTLAPLFGTAAGGDAVNVELTLDARNFYLLEAVLDGRITLLEQEGVVRVIRLSRFNEPVSIEPPQ
jgi:hypothetical protein